MPRFPRYGLFFAALAAMTLLVCSAHKHAVNPASATRPIDDWDFAELAIHLNRMGVEVRLRAVPKIGPVTHSAYLTCTAKEWQDLNQLTKDPKRIQDWCGTVYCERVGVSDPKHLLDQWGEHCLAVGPFLFYGDAHLLELVRAALSEYVPSDEP
jgi:hypothetical protein